MIPLLGLRSSLLLTILIAFALISYQLGVRLPRAIFPYASSEDQVPPDPSAQLGWVESGGWVNSDPSIPTHGWLDRMIANEDGEDMDWARNKTVLFLGDSVVRDIVWKFCGVYLGRPKQDVNLDSSLPATEKTTGWLCTHPVYNFRAINGFIYGVTNYSKYPNDNPLLNHEYPAPPLSFEDRIPELVAQYAPYNPDVIVLNSAAWDLKFLYRRDLVDGRPGLMFDAEEIAEYGECLRKLLRMVKAAYPGKKILWLQVQTFRTNDLAAKWFWAMGLIHLTNHDVNPHASPDPVKAAALPSIFNRPKVVQLAHTYRRIAAEEGVDDVDYWKVGEAVGEDGFIRAGDAIHPADRPSIGLVLEFLLEKVYRWDQFG